MKKILVIGAGFLQADVIKRAKQLGYYVYAVDGNANSVGFQFADEYAVIDIVDEKACLEYAREKGIDGVLTAATDYGVLSASNIAKAMKLPSIDYDVAKVIRNKYQVRKALINAKADDTEQVYEITCEQDIDDVKQRVKLPVMVKPCDGSGSRGAAKVEYIEDFSDACRETMRCSLTNRAVVESFIDGNEYGVESFVYNGEITVLAVMKKWMTKAPSYAELGHSIPCCLELINERYIKTCAEKAIRALNINFGAVNMDLIVSNNGSVHIVDVGARMGGNLIGSYIIPIGTGVDYITAIIRAAVGDEVCLEPKQEPKCVVTRILALTPGDIKELPNFEKIEEKFGVQIYHHLNVGETIREYHTNLDGCGYIVAVSDEYKTALENAEKALEYIDKNIVR